MATFDPILDITDASAPPGVGLLVLLTAMTPEQLERVLANLAAFSPLEGMLVAAPEVLQADSYPSLQFVAAPAASPAWTLTAGDFVNAYQLAEKNKARAILMLGPESGSLGSTALHGLAAAVLAAATDLAIPCYDLPRHAEFVDEPSALTGRSVGAQPFPEFVDFVLRIAVDDQRNGPIETETRPAVEREELLTLDLE